MVNAGRSKGCNTCKRRKVKCDEGKPGCQRCIRFGRECEGYGQRPLRVRFANERDSKNQRRVDALASRIFASTSTSTQPTIIPPPTPNKKDAALSFFLTQFATLGRSAASSTGFFEILPLVLSGERHDSAASLALSAVSIAMFERWLGFGSKPGASRKSFADAIVRLQTAIADPAECLSRATVVAALTLQFHDNVCALLETNGINRTHHDGSVALLRHQEQESKRPRSRPSLAFHILHTEVSFAIRERRSLPATGISWLQYHNDSLNPSSLLDIIGIDVANIQHEFFNARLSSSSMEDKLSDLFVKAAIVDTRLKTWAGGVPVHWQPEPFDHMPPCNPPIISYSQTFDVYRSVQIASIWNIWRIYRIITLKTMLECLELSTGSLELSDNTRPFIQESTQEMVDSICRSVPFFLGNRTNRATLHDFADSDIFLPSHHHLRAVNELDHRNDNEFWSQDDHFQNVISQGPWHMLIPLSQLMGIFSQNHGSSFAQLLEVERHKWIREQIMRARTIMGSQIGDYTAGGIYADNIMG
ncbi:hypothetical protein MKX08_009069 [Trichoderma sp. CBMAI-0020]|nr:hypothetical protein MKX08_009069 [Trichoderma sp. CBMAI-0020]